MRVAYVCTDPGVPAFGRKGASVHVQAVLRSLLRLGHDVHLVTAASPGDPPGDLAAVQLHRLPVTPPSGAGGAADREVRAQRVDARAGGVLDRLQAAGAVDLVYERYSLWGRTAMRWAAAHGVPSVLEVNAPLVEEQAAHRVLVDRFGAEQVALTALSSAGAVVCVSDAVAAWAKRHTTDPGRLHTLVNGVDTERVRPTDAPVTPATGTPFTVGFVGTLKPWHSLDTLVDAFALLVAADPTYRLLLVGDGPQAGALRTRVERAGVGDSVWMAGAVDHDEIPALLRSMDVAVAPYPPIDDFYFSPLKLFEYLAAGLPVVASAVGDLPRLLDHGRLGVLVEPSDSAALAAAVAALRADPGRRAGLGRAARRRAVERHDWSRVVGAALSLAHTSGAHPARPPARHEGVRRAATR